VTAPPHRLGAHDGRDLRTTKIAQLCEAVRNLSVKA
jgi:hypothetical protein